MLAERVMPCLLLNKNKLIKTTKFKDPDYIGDPINAVMIYNDLEVDELIFLDVTATIENRQPPFEVIKEIATECFMPFTYGGGIKDIEAIKKIFNLGAEKIVINSHGLENPELITEAAGLFGSQSIVVSIDVKQKMFGKYYVYTQSGRNATKINPVEYAKKMEQLGAGEIFLNSIDRDGTMDGFDLELIKMVSDAINIPLIVCGGAGEIGDIKKAVDAGASAIAAGSLFIYQNRNRSVLINYPKDEELDEILPSRFDR